MFSIRATYPDRICYRPDGVDPYSMAARVLLGNPDGVDPNSLARSVSSGRGSLHLAHADGPPYRIAHSTRGGIPCVDILHPDISQSDGRGWRFNFSGYTYPDLLIALTRRVFLSVYSAAVLSWSFLIFSTDILRYFRPIFWDILL